MRTSTPRGFNEIMAWTQPAAPEDQDKKAKKSKRRRSANVAPNRGLKRTGRLSQPR